MYISECSYIRGGRSCSFKWKTRLFFWPHWQII